MSTYFQDAFESLQGILKIVKHDRAVANLVSYVDRFAEALDLEESNGGCCGQHSVYHTEDWQVQAGTGQTRQGYWAWVADRLDEEHEKSIVEGEIS
jgi:hypothetical protein